MFFWKDRLRAKEGVTCIRKSNHLRTPVAADRAVCADAARAGPRTRPPGERTHSSVHWATDASHAIAKEFIQPCYKVNTQCGAARRGSH